MIVLFSISILWYISLTNAEANVESSDDIFYSRLSTSIISGLGTTGFIGILLANTGKSNIDLVGILIIPIIILLFFKRNYLIIIFNLYRKIKDDVIEALKRQDNKNYSLYIIALLVICSYFLSIGPINHADVSNVYVGFPNSYLNGTYSREGSIFNGYLGLADFANIFFIKNNNIWLIRTIQAIPILPLVLYLIKKKTGSIFIIVFLTSTIFVNWISYGKGPLAADICLAISYIAWRYSSNKEILKHLLIAMAFNLSFKISAPLILFPIFIDVLLFYSRNIKEASAIRIKDIFNVHSIVAISSLSSILIYKLIVSGNAIYPLFNRFIIPNNFEYRYTESIVSNYMRDFPYPFTLFIPKDLSTIGLTMGPATFILILITIIEVIRRKEMRNNAIRNVGLIQVTLLVLFAPGRADFYACPTILIISNFNSNFLTQLKFNFMNKKLFIYRTIFKPMLLVQFSIYLLSMSILFYQNIYTLIDYESGMNKFAWNYNTTNIISENAVPPIVNIYSMENRLFSNNKQVDTEKFVYCVVSHELSMRNRLNYKNLIEALAREEGAIYNEADKTPVYDKYQESLIYCMDKLNAKTIVTPKKFLSASSKFTCKTNETLVGARNPINRNREEFDMCTLKNE